MNCFNCNNCDLKLYSKIHWQPMKQEKYDYTLGILRTNLAAASCKRCNFIICVAGRPYKSHCNNQYTLLLLHESTFVLHSHPATS